MRTFKFLHFGVRVAGICCVLIYFLAACRSSNELQKTTKIFEQLGFSQQVYYKNSISNKSDFVNLLNFSKKGREIVFKKKHIEIDSLRRFIILEGYSNGWGDYVGFLFSESGSWYYRRSNNKSWIVKEIDCTEINFEKETGVAPEIVKTVLAWDTSYINNLKREVGNVVQDGSSFWAIKVDKSKSSETIINYTFYEYPIRRNKQ